MYVRDKKCNRKIYHNEDREEMELIPQHDRMKFEDSDDPRWLMTGSWRMQPATKEEILVT